MFVNFLSLLLAIVFAGICLSVTMLLLWVTARGDWYKVYWAAALLVLVSHVLAYAVYSDNAIAWVGALMVTLLPVGMGLLYAASRLFAFHTVEDWRVGAVTVVPGALALAPFVAGYDGAAIMMSSFGAAALMIMTGRVYHSNRSEPSVPMTALGVLYYMCGISFALCGLVLLFDGPWIIGGVPDNWAERLNIIVAITCLTAAGGFSIALDQIRLAQKHREDAQTDVLTGLINRRALFEKCEFQTFGKDSAIAMFDLDHFKQVNDMHGHAVGDAVLRSFGRSLQRYQRPEDLAARLGGEEFALVMRRVSPTQARDIVSRVIATFEESPIETIAGPLHCTVSAGVSFGTGDERMEIVLGRADKALYTAKNAGRNRVEFHELRRAI